MQRAEQWLAEGMDITPDGEWTERSNGIYSAVSDIMLIHAARLLNRPELLDPVRLNLRMMVYLVHPTGEVVTDYSGRQDLGACMIYHRITCRMPSWPGWTVIRSLPAWPIGREKC